ncbi:MAG: GumC family protein [Xenococcaceae cyanobacterium]
MINPPKYQATKYLENNSNQEQNEGGLNLTGVKETLLRRKAIIIGSMMTITALALVKALITPPIYSSSFELLSEPINIETTVTSTDDDSRKTREEIVSVELDEVQLKILKSHKLLLRTIESLQDRYPNLNYRELVNGLVFNIIIGSKNNQNILQVQYKHLDKQQVIDVLDSLSKTYLDHSIEERQSEVKRGIEFLNKQIPQVKSRVNQFQNQIQQIRSQYNFINPDLPIKQTIDRLNNLVEQRLELEFQLQELQLTSSNLKQELKEHPTTSPTAMSLDIPGHKELVARLKEIDLQIGQKSAIFSENSLEIQALKQERAEIVNLIEKEEPIGRQKINNQIKSLENRLQNLDSQIANFQQQIKQWSIVSNQYNNLQQRLTLDTKKLNEFILRKDALQIDLAQQEFPWQLITPPEEPKTSAISTINMLLLGSTLGLCLGIGAALIIDQYDNIIYTSSQVEELTNLPIIGAIPYNSKSQKLSFIKQINPKKEELKFKPQESQLQKTNPYLFELLSPSVEAFRFFASNLGFFDFNSNIKSVLITSAVPGEGKSTVALNLAKASAAMGKQVLLVDTDMRNSQRLSTYLGLSEADGLGNLLIQDYLDIQYFINKVPLEDNLSLLTTGNLNNIIDSTITDPGRLLASEKMYQLMAQLENHFDLVIYDTSAIIEYADVSLLAAKTDGIILVIGLGKIQDMKLSEALNQLKFYKTPVLGIAVNKLTYSTTKLTL